MDNKRESPLEEKKEKSSRAGLSRIRAEILLPVFCFMLSSCASSSRSVRLDAGAKPEAIYLQVADNYRRLQTFRGAGKLIIDSPRTQVVASATVLTRQPDSMFIKIEATFGVDAGFFFADRKRFESYSPFENTYFFGGVGELRRLVLFQVEVTYDEMLSAIVGAILPPLDSTYTLEIEDGAYRLEGRRNKWQLAYWVDPERGVVTKAEQRDPEGKLYSRQTFRRFRKTNGLWLPQHLQLDRPGQRERFTIYYDRVQVNGGISGKEFSMRVPPSVKRIELSARRRGADADSTQPGQME
jgi:outer membrane lipoprotein-sorting protein